MDIPNDVMERIKNNNYFKFMNAVNVWNQHYNLNKPLTLTLKTRIKNQNVFHCAEITLKNDVGSVWLSEMYESPKARDAIIGCIDKMLQHNKITQLYKEYPIEDEFIRKYFVANVPYSNDFKQYLYSIREGGNTKTKDEGHILSFTFGATGTIKVIYRGVNHIQNTTLTFTKEDTSQWNVAFGSVANFVHFFNVHEIVCDCPVKDIEYDEHSDEFKDYDLYERL